MGNVMSEEMIVLRNSEEKGSNVKEIENGEIV